MKKVQKSFGSLSVKYPTFRDESLVKINERWLEGKQIDDNAEGLWRVHDKLYDVTEFIRSHPGGSQWLELTKGIDITEQFETHHLSNKPEEVLKKFYVRDAELPRNYRYTYKDDGFYRTLKRRVVKMLPDLDYTPKRTSNIISDSMLGLTFATAIYAAKDNNIYLALLAGVFLHCILVIAHNYFHQKDNWRMFTLNLTLLNYTEWRISHAMSHHLYPNTYYDLETSILEPCLQWIPRPKTSLVKFLTFTLSPITWCLISPACFMFRNIGYVQGSKKFSWDHLIPFTLPLAMYYFGQTDLYSVLKLWTITELTCSWLLGLFGLNAGHHHLNISHEGDELPKGMDFGEFQMNAIIDRNDTKSSHFLTLVTYGHHTLHHMFPTLDHGLLSQLHDVLITTCKEFDLELRETPWWPLITGQFKQLLRTEPKTLKEMGLKCSSNS